MLKLMVGWLTLNFFYQESIGKLGSKELSNGIKALQYSPGGAVFYEKYLRQNSPLLIKGAARHWRGVKQWNNLTYINEVFFNESVVVEDENKHLLNIPFKQAMEKNLKIDYALPKDSKLLQDINLPLVLQCEEYIKKLSSVHLHMNNHEANNIKLTSKHIIAISLTNSFLLVIFGTSSSLSGENIASLNVTEIGFDQLDIPYKSVIVLPGDLVYIPICSWYHIASNEMLNYVTINFHYFSYDFQQQLPYIKILANYKEFLSMQAPNILCNNTRTSIANSLTIDFNDEVSVLHLRIPKRNRRPNDILLASGYKMPVLGLGTALLNETTKKSVKYAFDVGYRLFDLAYGYPGSEVGFAQALSESSVSREDVFISTKLHPKFLGYKETLFAIDESLKNLNMTYVDLYLIHSTNCDDFLLKCEEGEPHGNWKESWRAMEHAKREGKIRSLGVSNFYQEDLMELINWSMEPISVLQNWFDPFNQDVVTRKICTKYNIRYMGYSTLGSRWKMLGLKYNPVMESELITAIAGHHDYVVSHVVLRWAIHVNVTVIPRSSNENHISQNFRSLGISLHPSDIERINELNDWMEEFRDDDNEDVFEEDEEN